MKRIACVLVALLAACDRKPTPPGPIATTSNTPAAAVELPKGKNTYYFGANEARSNVTFTSKTNIMTILGSTNIVNGSATIDFEAGTGECHIVIPAAGLRTGMVDRDNAMWMEAWLDEKKHKALEFKSEKATFTKPNKWQISGKFKMRGVEKDMTIDATLIAIPEALTKKVQFGDGAWIRVKTSFKVNIADHGMDPKKSVVPVETEWPVEIDLYGTTAKPAKELVAMKHDENELPVVVQPRKLPKDGLEGKIYKFGVKPQHTTLSATSQTALERIVATTSTLSGWLGIDAEKGVAKVRLSFPVKTLRTGIQLRDEHLMGAQWLEADQFPHIDFESTKATKKDARTWAVEGNLTMHNVTRPVSCEVLLREIPNAEVKAANWGDKGGLGFSTTFKIKLTDFGIKLAPEALAKVSDELEMSVSLVALSE